MFKNLTLIFYVLCFLGMPHVIKAETIKTYPANDNNYNLSSPAVCPSNSILEKNKKWVEHDESWNKDLNSIFEAHLKLPLSPVNGSVYLNLVSVHVNRGLGLYPRREIVWSVKRTNQGGNFEKNNNCYLSGTVAYYVELKNSNGWPPVVQILNKPEIEEECLQKGDLGLIELRWYDPVEKRRHRWFNHRLALHLKWAKSYNYSPIMLPRVINELD